MSAASPMTGVSIVGNYFLATWSHDSLLPVQITQNALRVIELNDELSPEEEVALTAVKHAA